MKKMETKWSLAPRIRKRLEILGHKMREKSQENLIIQDILKARRQRKALNSLPNKINGWQNRECEA